MRRCDVFWTLTLVYTHSGEWSNVIWWFWTTLWVERMANIQRLSALTQITELHDTAFPAQGMNFNWIKSFFFSLSSTHSYHVSLFLSCKSSNRHLDGLSQTSRWLSLATQISAKIPTHYDHHQIFQTNRFLSLSDTTCAIVDGREHTDCTLSQGPPKRPHLHMIHYSTMQNQNESSLTWTTIQTTEWSPIKSR